MGKAQDILNGAVKLTISAAKTIYNSYQKEVNDTKTAQEALIKRGLNTWDLETLRMELNMPHTRHERIIIQNRIKDKMENM